MDAQLPRGVRAKCGMISTMYSINGNDMHQKTLRFAAQKKISQVLVFALCSALARDFSPALEFAVIIACCD
jgi:hypothetical protein